jgi:hypothetical protein
LVLVILGGIFAAIIVVVAIGAVFLIVKGLALDKESKEYADSSIRAVSETWDIKQFQDRESKEFRSATPEKDLEQLFTAFRKLGKLKEYKGSTGQAMMSATTQRGQMTTAKYAANADFEAGPAVIEINLIKHGERWEILGFRVNSKVFLPQ